MDVITYACPNLDTGLVDICVKAEAPAVQMTFAKLNYTGQNGVFQGLYRQNLDIKIHIYIDKNFQE